MKSAWAVVSTAHVIFNDLKVFNVQILSDESATTFLKFPKIPKFSENNGEMSKNYYFLCTLHGVDEGTDDGLGSLILIHNTIIVLIYAEFLCMMYSWPFLT